MDTPSLIAWLMIGLVINDMIAAHDDRRVNQLYLPSLSSAYHQLISLVIIMASLASILSISSYKHLMIIINDICIDKCRYHHHEACVFTIIYTMLYVI